MRALLYASILRKAAVQYVREIRYFLKAKQRYVDGAGLENNPNLILRKKTHHLERYLFSPASYTPEFAEDSADIIEKILENRKDIPVDQEKWARKILGEFKGRTEHTSSVVCPMLKNNVTPAQSPVAAEKLIELLRQRRSRRIFIDASLTKAEKIAICNAA